MNSSGRFETKVDRRAERVGRDSGITLIELLVVMVIISLFATLVGARLFSNVDKARQTTAKAQISAFETVLDLFRLDIGRLPDRVGRASSPEGRPRRNPELGRPVPAQERPDGSLGKCLRLSVPRRAWRLRHPVARLR